MNHFFTDNMKRVTDTWKLSVDVLPKGNRDIASYYSDVVSGLWRTLAAIQDSLKFFTFNLVIEKRVTPKRLPTDKEKTTLTLNWSWSFDWLHIIRFITPCKATVSLLLLFSNMCDLFGNGLRSWKTTIIKYIPNGPNGWNETCSTNYW